MRIEDVKLRNKSGKVAVLTTNVLLVTVAQWNTLQAISPLEDNYKIDKYMLSELLKSSCYTKTDSKHLFFVREEHLGSGFKSNTTLKIVGTTRELECILNDDSDQGKTIRSRFQAMADRNWTEEPSDFAKEFTETMDAMGIVDSNVRLTGSFGIHLREKRYILENTIYSNIVQRRQKLRSQ